MQMLATFFLSKQKTLSEIFIFDSSINYEFDFYADL